MRGLTGARPGCAIALFAVIACGGGATEQRPDTSADGQLSTEAGDRSRQAKLNEIERRHWSIHSMATDLGLWRYSSLGYGGLPVRTCSAISDSPCAVSCETSQAICREARRLCVTAASFADHDWANRKCRDGRQYCSEATRICCGCVEPGADWPEPWRMTHSDQRPRT